VQIHRVPHASVGEWNDDGKFLVRLQAYVANDALVEDGVDGGAVIGGTMGVAMERGPLRSRIAHFGPSFPVGVTGFDPRRRPTLYGHYDRLGGAVKKQC
jgi:hypothetical protein